MQNSLFLVLIVAQINRFILANLLYLFLRLICLIFKHYISGNQMIFLGHQVRIFQILIQYWSHFTYSEHSVMLINCTHWASRISNVQVHIVLGKALIHMNWQCYLLSLPCYSRFNHRVRKKMRLIFCFVGLVTHVFIWQSMAVSIGVDQIQLIN